MESLLARLPTRRKIEEVVIVFYLDIIMLYCCAASQYYVGFAAGCSVVYAGNVVLGCTEAGQMKNIFVDLGQE